jgi:CRISPR-associated protein Cmr5
MTTQTLEQKRAKHALDRIKALSADKSGKYATYVKALPAAILMNGLGQALATERAATDPEKAHFNLATHVSEWLLSPEAHTKYPSPGGGEDPKLDSDPARTLLNRIVAGNQDAYVWAQAEAIAYVTWLKKFASAFLEAPRKD